MNLILKVIFLLLIMFGSFYLIDSISVKEHFDDADDSDADSDASDADSDSPKGCYLNPSAHANLGDSAHTASKLQAMGLQAHADAVGDITSSEYVQERSGPEVPPPQPSPDPVCWED